MHEELKRLSGVETDVKVHRHPLTWSQRVVIADVDGLFTAGVFSAFGGTMQGVAVRQGHDVQRDGLKDIDRAMVREARSNPEEARGCSRVTRRKPRDEALGSVGSRPPPNDSSRKR